MIKFDWERPDTHRSKHHFECLYLGKLLNGAVAFIHVPQQPGMLNFCACHATGFGFQCCKSGCLKVACCSAPLGMLQPALPGLPIRSAFCCQLTSQRKDGLLPSPEHGNQTRLRLC